MGITYSTTATEFPVSIEELSLHAHVDGTEEDGGLFKYIGAATGIGQKWSDRQFCTATLVEKRDDFPCATRHNPNACIYVPRPPLQSVSSISYVASDGTATTMASTDYIVDASSEPGRIMPRYGGAWPTPRDQINAVTITFVAGYGSASAVPATIRTWVLSAAAVPYRFREAVTEENLQKHGFLDSLLACEDYGRV